MKKLIHAQNNPATRDPFITKHNNMYYRCFTDDFVSVSVSCADTIDNLQFAESKKVFIPEEGKEYSKQLWAPELHIIDGKCYIYVACDDGDNRNHRMYVLENGTDDPMVSYVMHGKITDPTDKWAIDGTVMEYKDQRYFVWSGWEGDVNGCQNLYIAHMKSPYEVDSERVLISTPEYDWEKAGTNREKGQPYINEGAYTFTLNGQLYMTYSGAGSWSDQYCIAMLKLVGDDPMNPKAWEKISEPIFSRNDLVKGAGHCSVMCEDGVIHVFFHAWDTEETKIVWGTVSSWHGELKLEDGKWTVI